MFYYIPAHYDCPRRSNKFPPSRILTIGPSFKIDAQATAKLDLGVDLTVGLNYNINGAQLVFPPNSGANQNQGAFNIGDTRRFLLLLLLLFT
jgi:hypothetical protein